MTETQNTESTETTDTTQETQDRSRQRQDPQQDNSQQRDIQIPKYRFDEMNRRAVEAEKRIETFEQAEEKRQTEEAEATGEFHEVLQRKNQELNDAKAEITRLKNREVRDKRFRAWTQGAAGTIRSDAMGDAFEYITEDEWKMVNEEDENSVKMLAQGLAERKSFLAGGSVGAGSGGSSRPVMGLSSNREVNDKRTTQLSSGRQTFAGFKKKRSHWK